MLRLQLEGTVNCTPVALIRRRTIEAVDRRLRETGSVATTRGSGGGRPHTITPALEQSILDAVYDDPTTSVRRLARQFGLSSSEVNLNPLFKNDRKGI